MPEGVSGEPVVEFVRWRPAPPLRPLVAWYSGYRSAGVEPATHREDAVLLGAAELAAAEVNGFAYLAF